MTKPNKQMQDGCLIFFLLLVVATTIYMKHNAIKARTSDSTTDSDTVPLRNTNSTMTF